MSKDVVEELMSIGVDIGKDTFHIVGFDCSGTHVLRKKTRRLALVEVFERLSRCVVGMEACLSAHFVSRTLRNPISSSFLSASVKQPMKNHSSISA